MILHVKVPYRAAMLKGDLRNLVLVATVPVEIACLSLPEAPVAIRHGDVELRAFGGKAFTRWVASKGDPRDAAWLANEASDVVRFRVDPFRRICSERRGNKFGDECGVHPKWSEREKAVAEIAKRAEKIVLVDGEVWIGSWVPRIEVTDTVRVGDAVRVSYVLRIDGTNDAEYHDSHDGPTRIYRLDEKWAVEAVHSALNPGLRIELDGPSFEVVDRSILGGTDLHERLGRAARSVASAMEDRIKSRTPEAVFAYERLKDAILGNEPDAIRETLRDAVDFLLPRRARDAMASAKAVPALAEADAVQAAMADDVEEYVLAAVA